MVETTPPRLLILETSGLLGQVALARGADLVRVQRLDETRRHARDLAPAVAQLLDAEGWRPREVDGLIVSRGPGSYTGLRVGIISAKAFAYATGCALIGIETFPAIASQVPSFITRADVIADAQQQKVYFQQFRRASPGASFFPLAPLAIRKISDWIGSLDSTVWISGPGVRVYGSSLPAGSKIVDGQHWDPQPASLLQLGLARYFQGERDDLWTFDPLYLRPSAAEEKWLDQPNP